MCRPFARPLAAVVLSGLTSVAVFAAQASTDVSGTWRYNADASDVGSSGGAEGGPPTNRLPLGGFGRPGRQPLGGPGAPGSFGGPSENPELRKRRVELMRELLEPSRRLIIEQDASSVTFTYDDGRTVRYRTDGRTEKHQATHGVVETKTRWKKGRLVRETDLDDGQSIEETFTIASPRALVLEVKVHGGAGRRKPLRRVYDPIE